MTDATIHSIQVSYEEEHEGVKDFLEYLERGKMKEEFKSYCKEAYNSPDFKIHLEDKYGREFTLVCQREHHCILKRRGM